MKRRLRSRPRRVTKRRRYARKRSGRFGKRARFSRRGTPYLRVRRTCYLGQFTPNTVSTNGFWQYRTVSLTKGFIDQSGASMGGLSNLSEYVAMFDLYKLKACKVTLRPNYVNMTTEQIRYAGASVAAIPYVTTMIDPSDNVTPSGAYSAGTLNTFLEQGRVRTRRADRSIIVYFKPKIIEQYGAGADRYVWPQWTRLDNAAGQDMPHRGYHMFFHNQNMDPFSVPINYDVHVTYYLQFKGAK